MVTYQFFLWLAVCPGAIQLLRSPQGTVVGLTAVMPIYARTLGFVKEAPLSRGYFGQLGQAELRSYATADNRGDKWFIYAMDVDNLEDDRLRSDMARLRFELLLRGSLVLASPPPGDYYETALRSFGFEPVPETGHSEYGETYPAFVYKADTRTEKLLPYIGRLMAESVSETGGGGAASAAGDHTAALQPGQQRLTPREREVAELLVNGCTNEQIAKQLYMSVAAVKKHVNAMFRKYGVHNRTQFAGKLLAGRNGSEPAPYG